jgi:hypothetical protein
MSHGRNALSFQRPFGEMDNRNQRVGAGSGRPTRQLLVLVQRDAYPRSLGDCFSGCSFAFFRFISATSLLRPSIVFWSVIFLATRS